MDFIVVFELIEVIYCKRLSAASAVISGGIV